MVTGFNTDVQYEGRVFHVQTEDKGRDNPVVESLVYTGGEIVTSRRTSYADLIGDAGWAEAEVQRRMEAQHQTIIREILGGRFDPEGPKPFGYNIITNRSFDEVVLEFLGTEAGLERIALELGDLPALCEGTRPILRLRVTDEGTGRAVAAARVRVKLLTTKDKPREVYSGTTDDDGWVEATFEVPDLGTASAAVLFQAEASGKHVEIKRLIMKDRAPNP